MTSLDKSAFLYYVRLDIMSNQAYTIVMADTDDKPVVWLHGEVKTPPFSFAARVEAGMLLGLLQNGTKLSLPHSRPMPSIGKRCHELRITDENAIWRIVYRTDADAIVIGEVFKKKTGQTPRKVIDACRCRFTLYDEVTK